MKPVILLVEDEESIAEPLAALLRREGFAVDAVATGAAARAAVARDPALVILDWMLPDAQGIDLLRDWRRQGRSTPVIFLTARTDLVDKVLGLEMGADDFVTKPFEPRELVARVRACLRRSAPAAPAGEDEEVLRAAGITMSLRTREVRFRGEPVELPRMAFELLKLFLESPGRVFARDEILDRVWGYESYPTTRTVDNHVLQLRQKLDPDLFETIRGIGYRLRAADET